MKLVFANQPLGSAVCGYWSHATATSSPSGPPHPTVDHYEAEARIGPGEIPPAIFDCVRDRLLAYDIFPPALIRYTVCPEQPIRTGATIVQRVQLGLLALEAAVQVIDVWDRAEGDVREAGFSYVTLRGHPECGIATFGVRLDGKGTVTVFIDARSRPGLLLTRLGRPIARAFQRAITRAALRRLAEI